MLDIPEEDLHPSHTPAPWSTGKHGTPDYAPQYGVYADDGKHIATIRGDSAEADSRLIAAAPDGLVAAKLAAECLREHTQYDEGEMSRELEALNALVAFIDKAEGK